MAATVRVDSRLVHSRVVEAWIPALGIDTVVVVDEKTAGDAKARSAMSEALPEDVALKVLRPGEPLLPLLGKDRRILVLVPNVFSAKDLYDRLGKAGRDLLLNVGILHEQAGRRSITDDIHLSEPEIEALFRLSETGVKVELKSIPDDAALGLEDARSRYQKSLESSTSR